MTTDNGQPGEQRSMTDADREHMADHPDACCVICYDYGYNAAEEIGNARANTAEAKLTTANARNLDLQAQVVARIQERDAAERALEAASAAKDGAYTERNLLVALLARLFPSGIRRTAIEGWEPEWHGCVYIDTPMGQMSWHYHDMESHLFASLPEYKEPWDEHTTEEKYTRVLDMLSFLGIGRDNWARVHPSESARQPAAGQDNEVTQP